MATSPKESGEIPSCGAARGNLSKSFAGLRRTFPALRRKPEKERSAPKQVAKKPGVELFVFARLLEQVRQSERGKKPQTHTVYDRHSIKEIGKRSRITPSRPHHIQ